MQAKRTSRSPISVEHLILVRTVRELRARRAFSQEVGFHSGPHRNDVGAVARREIKTGDARD